MLKSIRQILPFSLINLLLFGLFFTLLFPLFNSGDDVWCLYRLGGGYGFPPASLLNFNHVLHPFISVPIRDLFVSLPAVNWYALVLILFHYLATTIIFREISRGRFTAKSFLLYLIIFLVFESPFLLSLTFTNTSIILTLAGILLWISDADENRRKRKDIYGVILFLTASLFRIHTLIPFVGIALPFLFVRRKQRLPKVAALMFITAAAIIGLNQFHQYYNKKYIIGWEEGEQYQQVLYKYFNKSGIFDNKLKGWQTEKELVKNGLVFDTSYLNRAKLTQMYEESVGEKEIIKQHSEEMLKWLWVNNKIYFFTFLFFITFCPRNPIRMQGLISFMLLVLGMGFLFLYLKPSDYVIVGSLAIICMLIVALDDRVKIKLNSYRFASSTFLMAFLIFWACIRIYKTDNNNRQNNLFFKNAAREIRDNSDRLFFVQGYGFPLDYFYVFDVPIDYPMKNITLEWHNPEILNVKILQSFGIHKIEEIPENSSVLIYGKEPQRALLDYFEMKTGEKYIFSPPLDKFKFGEVKRIIKVSRKKNANCKIL